MNWSYNRYKVFSFAAGLLGLVMAAPSVIGGYDDGLWSWLSALSYFPWVIVVVIGLRGMHSGSVRTDELSSKHDGRAALIALSVSGLVGMVLSSITIITQKPLSLDANSFAMFTMLLMCVWNGSYLLLERFED